MVAAHAVVWRVDGAVCEVKVVTIRPADTYCNCSLTAALVAAAASLPAAAQYVTVGAPGNPNDPLVTSTVRRSRASNLVFVSRPSLSLP